MVGEGNGSKTGSPSTLKSSNTQEIESENPLKIDPRSPASPTSPPHTHSHRHYHTSPSHHSHQAHSDRRAEQRRKTGPRHTTRRGSPDCDGDYDVITRSEVRELTERRTRSNAVGAKEEEQRRREEEGRKEEERRRREEERRREEKREEERRKRDLIRYDGPPVRSQHPSEADQRVNDIRVDENMRLVFSLDVFITPEEQVVRLVRVNTPSGLGQCQTGYVLVTTESIYILRRDGIEGLFSREIGVRFRYIDHLVIGLCWQSVEMVYQPPSLGEEGRGRQPAGEKGREASSGALSSCVILTGNEAVSRSVMTTIQSTAAKCPSFRSVVPKNRDDESRLQAIRNELSELGNETSMDIVQYSLVTWEQVKGEPPMIFPKTTDEKVRKSGVLHFKTTSVLGRLLWKQAYFELRNGILYQYSSETDKVSKGAHPLRGCGGCTRISWEGKQFVISVALNNTQPLLLATANEEELTHWMQALCEGVVQAPLAASRGMSCAVLITSTKIHILQEDLSNQMVQQITWCDITAIEQVYVDKDLPFYCTLSYDDGDSSVGEWLICFNSEQELGKFESTLGPLWKEAFQVDLPFAEVADEEVKERAYSAVELMHASGLRSDSITKGRTEFTYPSI